MGRFTKEDIGYLAMKQVSEGKVCAWLGLGVGVSEGKVRLGVGLGVGSLRARCTAPHCAAARDPRAPRR